jgi:formate dehydrogenase major subunit
MIKYIIENEKYFKPYVAEYTNAAFILSDDYAFNDGLFSGYDPATHSYNKKSWSFKRDADGIPLKDRSLENPRCVFQQLKQHFSRYDLDTVSAITGTSKADLETIYQSYAMTGQKGKAGTIMYAMGWTQHTVGVQNIRTMAIIQLLLGNMGVAGGGVNALRGESNVQGSTDHCILYHIWPGYLANPSTAWPALGDYLKRRPESKDPLSANWWQNEPKYMVSLLKSFFGDKATQQNDFGYNWMPKLDAGQSYSWLDLFDTMYQGKFSGFFAWGQNPAASGANANKTRQALTKLDWMVNVNIFDNETGSFWKGPGMDPGKIKTEVFMLPCAVSVEKEGSITNSGRWSQWRYKAAEAPGDARPDGDILIDLMKKVKWFYRRGLKRGEAVVFPEPILNLKWDYTTGGRFDSKKMAKEINGYFQKDVTVRGKSFKKGDLVPSFAYLQADGSTSSANWLYCNSWTAKGNMAARRKREESGIGLNLEWSWCWPVNRRIIYNRASVDLYGKPWDAEQPVIQWDAAAGKWTGDVPDGGWPPMLNADGTPNPKTKYPFIMKTEGFAHIFGPGRADGPFPEHYEPLECPVEKNLLSSQLINPTAPTYGTDMDIYRSCDPRYPFVGTTYRVSEHWQTGVMTRWQPWLLELQPQLFVEMSLELAELRGIQNGDKVRVISPRGEVTAVAVVTPRFKPFNVQGNTVHQVGLPYHYGWVHPKDGGDSANLLTPSTGDPNTRIPETKAFMVNIAKA